MNRPCKQEETQVAARNIKPALVLVIDDEATICWGFQRMLQADGHQVIIASSAEEGLELAVQRKPQLVLLDVRLPDEDGITALPKIIAATDGAPVIVMTAFGDLETAVSAVQNGASDYLTKPFRLEDAKRICSIALRSSIANLTPTTPTQQPDWDAYRIIGKSPAIQNAYKQIALVARSDLSVLITGETGTGKELVAAAIHRHSGRSDKPYLPVSPVAMNPDLIESELFGHVRGAFTGAIADRAGLFEQAAGGTILLDEIGDLPVTVQVKLLRVLEQGEYCRVGEVTSRKCNLRILAATNANLHDATRQGVFREDLFYRLNGLHIHLPPLRERPEDIGPLCDHFLQRLNYGKAGTVGSSLNTNTDTHAIDDALFAQLKSRLWRGNVRELKHAVEHAAVVARGRLLTIEDFPPEQSEHQTSEDSPSNGMLDAVATWTRISLQNFEANNQNESSSNNSVGLHTMLLNSIEPTLLRIVLEHANGNRAKASEMLGIHRSTLREKLRSYGLDEIA